LLSGRLYNRPSEFLRVPLEFFFFYFWFVHPTEFCFVYTWEYIINANTLK
jgi:hypothetical protein